MNKSSAAWYVVIIILASFLMMMVLHIMRYVKMPEDYEFEDDFWRYPFKTGDLIITSHKIRGLLNTTWVIRTFTRSNYNHIAIAYVDPYTKQVFFWEMNQGGSRLASRYNFWTSRIGGRLMVRPLNKPVDQRIFMNMMAKQWDLIFNPDFSLAWGHRMLPEPFLPIPVIKGHHWGGGEGRTCAHLAAEMYAALGVFDFHNTGIDPQTIFPCDYAKPQIDKTTLPLTNGYEFGPLILLKGANQSDDFTSRDK